MSSSLQVSSPGKSRAVLGNLRTRGKIYGHGEKFTGMGGKSVAGHTATNGSCPARDNAIYVSCIHVCLAFNASNSSLLFQLKVEFCPLLFFFVLLCKSAPRLWWCESVMLTES